MSRHSGPIHLANQPSRPPVPSRIPVSAVFPSTARVSQSQRPLSIDVRLESSDDSTFYGHSVRSLRPSTASFRARHGRPCHAAGSLDGASAAGGSAELLPALQLINKKERRTGASLSRSTTSSPGAHSVRSPSPMLMRDRSQSTSASSSPVKNAGGLPMPGHGPKKAFDQNASPKKRALGPELAHMVDLVEGGESARLKVS